MSLRSEPETPLHAPPNEYLDLNNVKELDEKDIADLDLDPTLEDSLPPSALPSTTDLNTMKRSFDNHIGMNGNDNGKMHTMFDNVDDFTPSINVESPFSSNTNLYTLSSAVKKGPRMRKLSMSQQSKFISYVDSRVMEIQRKFVQSRGLNNKTGYTSLTSLLIDIKTLIDFIWYSVDNIPNTDYLLKNTSLSVSLDQSTSALLDSSERSQTTSLIRGNEFGQTSYILKIADDMMDYIEKFKIVPDDSDTISKVFKLFFIFDKIFSKLIRGDNANHVKLCGTDKVRFTGIAERARVKLPLYFESLGIHGYHFELSKIYEESLDE